ncbi:MAG TPA: phosphoglycerate mutase family protein [Prosthecobacter sp.]
MPHITFIRHGESEANAGLPTLTPGCIRLTELGHRQATELAGTIAEPPCLIVVSPYIRTHLTAAPLRTRYPAVPVEEWPVHEFTYLNPLHYSGTTETQRGEFARHYWTRCDPHWNDGGGAESFADLIARIDHLEHRLHERAEKNILVFTHGFFIKALLLRRDQPEAAVDATLMAAFRDGRKNDHLANTGIVRLGRVGQLRRN